MLVSELYGPKGPMYSQDVYIVGLGPSMSVFPLSYLEGRFCILLKDAWALFPTLKPLAFATNLTNFRFEDSKCQLPYQVVKARHKGAAKPERDDNHVPWLHPDYYCYSYREKPWDVVSHTDAAVLWKEPCHYFNYRNSSVAVFAVQMAVLAGAKTVTLLGCDCGELMGREYASGRVSKRRTEARMELRSLSGKSKKKGVMPPPPRDRHNYDAYREGLELIQMRSMRDYGVPVVSLLPFMGIGQYGEQFNKLRLACKAK